nr:unnamed protein product [Spirometra erinaceieuropaei]
MLQPGMPAPEFKGTAVVNGEFKEISLSDYKKKYVILFFYPLDFTFVCPTEIIAFSDRADEFRRKGCELIACSTDSHFSHLAWTKTSRKEGGIEGMNIPILADKTMSISRSYGVLCESSGVAFRGLFIIDGKGILRQITINDLPVATTPSLAVVILNILGVSSIFPVVVMDAYRNERPKIRVTYRTEGHLLSSPRMQTSTRPSMITIHDLLFANDCALNTMTEAGMQRGMELFTSGCVNFGLVINTGRTVIRHQSPPNAVYSLRRIHINDTHLKTMDNFAYLSSTLSRCIEIDDEVAHWIYKASQGFGWLQNSL